MDQLSREELKVNDVEDMRQQLEQEQKIQQKSREKQRQIRERVRERLKEHGGDLPMKVLFEELQRQKTWDLISDHHLEEELFFHQQDRELLSKRVQDLHNHLETEFSSGELRDEQRAREFADHLEEPAKMHERREWDATPIIKEMQEELKQEQKIQQKSREKQRQIRESIRRPLRERGEDLPMRERLNELLRQKIWHILSNDRLEEELFPHSQASERLRNKLQALWDDTITDYTFRGFQLRQIGGEFGDQLEVQMRMHNRSDWELTQAREDLQERLTQRRPQR